MRTNKLKTFLIIALVNLALSINLGAQEVKSTKKNNKEKIFKTKFSSDELKTAPVKLIPFPQKVSWSNESAVIGNLHINDSKEISSLLHNEIKEICDENQINLNSSSDYTLNFSNNNKLSEEGYTLEVTESGIFITASNETGYFYALQTLRQLILKKNTSSSIQLCKIADEPKFPIRGFMVDVGRNYQSIPLLKKQLDIMAKYKMNTFHWHLTDRPAWRIESKIYPELIAAENHRASRNPGKYYTYEEIREFIKYANDKQINVIPEIDMPGHSDSFRKSMGCRMESKEGMKILKNVLKEFFNEIPKNLAPIIHIGSDEVHIKNPDEFVSTMVDFVEDNDRKVMVWSPGLEAKKSVIKQTWGSKKEPLKGHEEIDSKYSYINTGEPMSFINELFFRPIGEDSKNHVLGGILCLWPDVNVWSETDIYRQHPVYSALLTYAWRTWTDGIISRPKSYKKSLPLQNTPAADYFSAYEQYLIAHKELYFKNLPFEYYVQSDKHWELIGPFDKSEGDFIMHNDLSTIKYKGNELAWKEANGNTLTVKSSVYYPEIKPGQTVYARTYIHSEENTTLKAYINFDSPSRANRAYSGIAENGSWDINGGEIWINDQLLKGPKWDNPGWKPFKQKTWAFGIDSEIPWTDEELYWLRKPANIPLKKGWNTVYVKIPGNEIIKNYMFTFVPLDMSGIRFSTNRH